MIYRIAFLLLVTAVLSCSQSSDSASLVGPESQTGIAGSYARFMVVGDFMYVVDTRYLNTYSLANPALPVHIDRKEVGQNVETVYNLGNRLFIGSGEGLFIYTIGNGGLPQKQGEALYNFPIEPCDPVVANDSLAFVTLSTVAGNDNPCGRTVQVNQLLIYDVKDIQSPDLIVQYEMQNPKGVGLDGTTLFVCENEFGLRIYDVQDPTNIQLMHHVSDISAFDVIPLGGLLLVVGPDNIYQYDYSDLSNIRLVSQIPILS